MRVLLCGNPRRLGLVKQATYEAVTSNLSASLPIHCRSKKRQADKAYFAQKSSLNATGKDEVGERKNKRLEGEGEKYVKEEGGVEEGEGEEDPFKLKFRSKIGGQYA